MKKTRDFNFPFLLFIALLFVLVACEKDSDEDLEREECEATAWSEAKHYDVMPKVRVLVDTINGFCLKDAKLIGYDGVISKYYCKNNISGTFHYTPSQFYPEFIEEEYWTGGFLIAEAYGFNFQNDLDYLDYHITFEAVFDDFNIFHASFDGEVMYNDIYTSIDELKQFFYVDINSTYWIQK